jgi:hypothetical protein
MGTQNQQLSDGAVHNSGDPVHSEGGHLLDIDQAAALLGMSRRWLYRNYGLIAHVRIGHGTRPRVLFRRADLEIFILARRITPGRHKLCLTGKQDRRMLRP